MGEVPFFEKDKGQVKNIIYYIIYYIGVYIYIYGAESLSFVLSGQNRSNLMRVNLLREYFPLVLPVLPVLTRLSSASLCIELERDVSNLTGREALSFLQKKTPEAEQVYPGAIPQCTSRNTAATIPNLTPMSRPLCVLLCARAHMCVRPIPKSPEFNRGSYPRTRRTWRSATTIHPDPIPSFYPTT